MKKIVCMLVTMCTIFVMNSSIDMAMSNGIEKKMKKDEEARIYMVEEYLYPITPEDEEWDELVSVEKKLEACRIDEKILKSMTNEALIQAIIDFPFLCELFCYNSYEKGVDVMSHICDAYRELLNRDDGKEALVNAIDNRKSTYTINKTAEQEIVDDALSLLVLYQQKFIDEFDSREVEMISEFSSLIEFEKIADSTSYSNSNLYYYIKTPNGSFVGHYLYSCSHSSSTYHETRDQSLVDTFGVELVRVGSCIYNCHSYAWYSQQVNPYWIPNPAIYMTDESYYNIMSGLGSSSIYAYMGDIIFYGSVEEERTAHSAILISAPTGAPLATRNVRSKWGASGVFEHSVSTVPSEYDTTSVSVWRRSE